MYQELILTDGEKEIILNKELALNLELKFNLTDNGRKWKHIGDVLYNFSINKINDNELKVTVEQFNYLSDLINKVIEETFIF